MILIIKEYDTKNFTFCMHNIKYHIKFHEILVHFGLFCVTCTFWQFSCRLEISFRSPRPKWNYGISFRSMISFHLKRVNNMWSLVERRNETHAGLKFRFGPNFISATCNKPLKWSENLKNLDFCVHKNHKNSYKKN